MVVTESFNRIFQKFPLRPIVSDWDIIESDSQSTFTGLRIQYPGCSFHVVSQAVYKDMPCLTTKLSSFLQDCDCDGIAFTEKEGKMWVVLAELKSTLDSTDILKAYKQIVFSYLKIHSLLSLCDGFSAFTEWNLLGIIACRPPKDNYQKTQLDLLYLNMSESNSAKPDVRCMLRLYKERKLKTSFGNIPFLKRFPLDENLKGMSFTLCLHTAAQYADSTSTLDFTRL